MKKTLFCMALLCAIFSLSVWGAGPDFTTFHQHPSCENSIDETEGGFTIAIDTTSALEFCAGSPLTVLATVTGSANAGNVFSLELSDNSGSFTSPIIIGTDTNTSLTSITGTIPIGTPSGTGYRVRISADNPASVSSDNGYDLSVLMPTIAGNIGLSSTNVCQGEAVTVSLSGFAGGILWASSTNGGASWNTLPDTTASFLSGPINQFTQFRAIVTNGTCQPDTVISATVTISFPPVPGTLSANPTQVCTGGSTFLTVTGGSTDFYGWETSSDATNFFGGIFTSGNLLSYGTFSQDTWMRVKVERAGCPDDYTNIIKITVLPELIPGFIISQNGLTVTITDQSSGATSWSYLFGDGNSSTAANPTHTYATPGSYTITQRINNIGNCPEAKSEQISVITSQEAPSPTNTVTISPNPANESVRVSMEDGRGTWQLKCFDMTGKLCLMTDFQANQHKDWDISTLTPGLYQIMMVNESGTYEMAQKLMIQ